jgi:methylated-DNA-[protein]-cysteine S-methyltransferase
MSVRTHDFLDSPLGPITVLGDEGRLGGLFFEVHRWTPGADRWGERAPGTFAAVAEQLDAYFAGDRKTFDVELHLPGTEFQRRVWTELQQVPFGATTTYAELAEAIGRPGAARAVGAANGRNPVSIIVPCHRVVGADGTLTGYGGGLPRKQALLTLEHALPRRSAGRSARLAELPEELQLFGDDPALLGHGGI